MVKNIFVLCTGRCGSVTFAKACQWAENYTAGHETVGLRWGLSYPDNHIEVNNRLVWYFGLLNQQYPEARYVHLRRDPDAVARSYAPRQKGPAALMLAWRRSIRMGWFPNKRKDPDRKPLVDAREMVDAINANIELFLSTLSPSRWVTVDIQHVDTFQRFWEWAGLRGDLVGATKTFRTKHNVSKG